MGGDSQDSRVDPMTGPRRLRTEEAAARLGIKPTTLYAYVSRGLISSERDRRGSTFDAQEVESLARTSRRDAALTRADRPMAFVTELTLIEDGHLYYRGEDAAELAGRRSFEEVAEWLWTGEWPQIAEPDFGGHKMDGAWDVPLAQGDLVESVLASLPASAAAADRYKLAVAGAAVADPLRHDLTSNSVVRVGRCLVAILSRAASAQRSDLDPSTEGGASVAKDLLVSLGGEPGSVESVRLVDAALTLLADHELAASTLAARTAAAFGADPYAVVGAGLAAASGPLHAAASLEVERMLADARSGDIGGAIGSRLGRNGSLCGMGMALYPDGDPRAARLLELLRSSGIDPDRQLILEEVLSVVERRSPTRPNVDFALGALTFVLGLAPGSAEAIFVTARTVGWIAHAMEQYTSDTTFRVRATYVGRRGQRSGLRA